MLLHPAEDVVQDVFVKLWNGQAVFDAALGSGFGFLATITRNRALDIARRKTEVAHGDDDDMDDVMDDLQKELFRTVFALPADEDSVQRGVQLALVGRYFERVADHAVNFGERIWFMVNGTMEDEAPLPV